MRARIILFRLMRATVAVRTIVLFPFVANVRQIQPVDATSRQVRAAADLAEPIHNLSHRS